MKIMPIAHKSMQKENQRFFSISSQRIVDFNVFKIHLL